MYNDIAEKCTAILAHDLLRIEASGFNAWGCGEMPSQAGSCHRHTTVVVQVTDIQVPKKRKIKHLILVAQTARLVSCSCYTRQPTCLLVKWPWLSCGILKCSSQWAAEQHGDTAAPAVAFPETLQHKIRPHESELCKLVEPYCGRMITCELYAGVACCSSIDGG